MNLLILLTNKSKKNKMILWMCFWTLPSFKHKKLPHLETPCLSNFIWFDMWRNQVITPLLEDIHFIDRFLEVRQSALKNLLYMSTMQYTWGSWSSCENCNFVDEYDENCRRYNPCKLHIGYAVQFKDRNFCLEEVCDSHSIVYLSAKCHDDKCGK